MSPSSILASKSKESTAPTDSNSSRRKNNFRTASAMNINQQPSTPIPSISSKSKGIPL